MTYINPEELNLSDKSLEVEYYDKQQDCSSSSFICLTVDPYNHEDWEEPPVCLDKQDIIKLAKLLKITGEDLK